MTTTLDRLRSVHHKAARMFAAGFSVCEIARETGRDEKNIANLEADPTFVGLVCFYRNQSDGERN